MAESLTISNEYEETETKAPNSQDTFSPEEAQTRSCIEFIKNSALAKVTKGNGKQFTIEVACHLNKKLGERFRKENTNRQSLADKIKAAKAQAQSTIPWFSIPSHTYPFH